MAHNEFTALRGYPAYVPRPVTDADVKHHNKHKHLPVEELPIDTCPVCRAVFSVE